MKPLKSFKLFVKTHWRGLALILLIFVGLYFTLNVSFHAVASHTGSCSVCHVMDPYIRSWDHSTHTGISCVTCHELPLTYFTDASFKNLTGGYDPRLRANVKNETCLQSGCHSLEVVQQESGFGQELAFDHQTHMTGLRRGEKLRCTSCHASDRTGNSHFTTDQDTCYLCHFKGADQGRSVTPCQTCHTLPPSEVEHGGFKFEHQNYVNLGVSCSECHTGISSGEGGVPTGTCNDCHTERLQGREDFELMHDTHVTEQGISCFDCHDRIEHKATSFVGTLDIGCDSCHGQKHGNQKQIYMGTGGQGMVDVPSRMFAAKVSCEGCHVELSGGQQAVGTGNMETLRQSCVRCHGEGYDTMLDIWLTQMDTAMQYARPVEQEGIALRQALRQQGVDENEEFFQILQDGLWNINLVRDGHGVHNVEYAVKLVNTSVDQINLAAEHYGRQVSSRDKPAVLRQPDGYCMELCHNTINSHDVEYFAEMEIYFDHDSHTLTSCTTCHSADKHKENIISVDGCMDCHHTTEAQEAFSVGCADCHTAESELYNGEFTIAGLDIEPDSMAYAEISCLDCHSVQAHRDDLDTLLGRCNECHTDWGVEPEVVNDVFVEKEVGFRQRTDRMILRIDKLRQHYRRQGAAEADVAALDNIEQNLDRVLKGRAHHNWVAAELILDKVAEDLNRLETALEQ